MKQGKRLKTYPGKPAKIIGLTMIAVGAIILLCLIYTDAYTLLKQVKLRKQWDAVATSANVAGDHSRKTLAGGAYSASRDTTGNAGEHLNLASEDSSIDLNRLKVEPEDINPRQSPEHLQSSPTTTEHKSISSEHAHIKPGSAFARIVIPRIKLDAIVVEGVEKSQLAIGPGHMEETAWPGEIGNMVISGHRVTHSRPFYYLDRLEIGDPITVYTKSQKFEYFVVERKVVAPTDLSVTQPTKNKVVTLTTCNPRFSAKTRLVVHAKMD